MPTAEHLLEQLYKVLLLLGLFYHTRNFIVFPLLPKTFLSSFPHFAGVGVGLGVCLSIKADTVTYLGV